jgi:hypothetical protein
MHGEAQTVGWSTMTIDDLQVAGRQRVEAPQVTLGEIGGDAHERIALLGDSSRGGLATMRRA